MLSTGSCAKSAGCSIAPSRGKLLLTGAEAAEYLQGQLTNDIEALAPGEGCYAALLDRKGHMQADMRVLRLADDEIWVDTEAEALAGRHGATSRCTRSAARSRSRTSSEERALALADRPAQRRALRRSAPPRARLRTAQRQRHRVPRGRHRARHRPDRPSRRRASGSAAPWPRPARSRSAPTRSRSSASRPARRASAPRWIPRRCPPRPASSRPRSTSRRAATSARRRSPACTTGASRTGTCAGCG